MENVKYVSKNKYFIIITYMLQTNTVADVSVTLHK